MVRRLLSSAARGVAALAASAANALSYDATEPKGKRKSIPINTRSEDEVLDRAKRGKLQANSADIQRNFSIAGWAVRRHLDYVSSFQFHSRTGNQQLDGEIEYLMNQWFRPYNCDVAARHSFPRMIRMTEAHSVVYGDHGLVKLGAGNLQALMSDRIRDPNGIALDGTWRHGVKVNDYNRALAYAVHKRTKHGLQFERVIPANNLCLHGYFEACDQVRGISPLAPALNPLRDVYEGFDYALAKAKVSQLFAFLVLRKGLDAAAETTNDDPNKKRSEYAVNFGKGPVFLDMEPGDDARMLESATPSTQFQDFSNLMIMVALKALDIPFSFFDESHTNFFGSRGAWLHYERSCHDKRERLQELLRRLTIWRLMLFLLDGDLRLPAGTNISDLQWEWVPVGMPWWDPAKEINGDLLAIGAGLDNPQRITKERGRGDWYDNIDRIAEAIEYARGKQVPLSFVPGLMPPDEPEKHESGKDAKKKPPEKKAE
jgi:capsid protein